VPGELLDGGEVAYGVEEVPDEAFSEVVGETSFILASLCRRLTFEVFLPLGTPSGTARALR
jgi:hypothetical protein